MQATISLNAGFVIQAPPQTDKDLAVLFPTFGPFAEWGIEVGELGAGQCSDTFDLGGRSSVLFLALTGNAIFRWDYNPATADLDNELRFCGLPDCPNTNGPAFLIPLPVCDIEHAQICAASGCGVQYEFGHFGTPAPAGQ